MMTIRIKIAKNIFKIMMKLLDQRVNQSQEFNVTSDKER